MNNRPVILIIDDELCVRQSLRFILKDDYDVITAPGAVEGLFLLSSHNIDIVLLDIRLRDINGLNLLHRIKNMYPYVETIMITAYASLETIRKAIRYGSSDYLIKPFDTKELLSVVQTALMRRHNKLFLKNELDKLKESTLYMENLISDAKNTMINSSENVMSAILLNINSRDGYTWSHVNRVAKLSSLIAEKMSVPDEHIQWLKCAAFLHDIGKVNIDEDILNKESKLTYYEYAVIKKHPEIGADILKPLPFLNDIIPSIRHHHERYDGSGYPCGLRGKGIPFKARVMAVADAVDSMINSPVRRTPYMLEDVKRELQTHAGTQFDPEIVSVVIRSELLTFAQPADLF